MKPEISLIIPAYNEAGSIAKVVKEIQEETKKLKRSFEIIIVDDGSVDGTAAIVSKLGVRLIRHPYNKGYGASLKTGAINAKSDFVLYIDGDGQHYASDIKSFLKGFGSYDMVVGARSKQASALRSVGKFIMQNFANYLAERKIPDLNSGFRLIRKDLVLKYLHILPNAFSFTTTITMALIKEGYTVDYVPIRIKNRQAGSSSIKPFKDGFRFMMLIIRMTMLFSPLKVFIPISLFLFATGIPLLLYRIITLHQSSETAVLLTLSGLLVFLFGLIADQNATLIRKNDGR